MLQKKIKYIAFNIKKQLINLDFCPKQQIN